MKDPLARYYTPDHLAQLILERRLVEYAAPLSWVVEPSAGGGAFTRAAVEQGRPCLAVDIDPRATALHQATQAILGDWLSVTPQQLPGADSIIVGNPPFPTGAVARQHVEHCVAMSPRCVSLILPLEYWGQPRWQELMTSALVSRVVDREVWHTMGLVSVEPIVPRPWPANVRETACFTWARDDVGRGGGVRAGPPLRWYQPSDGAA